jgi:hypothetical protein
MTENKKIALFEWREIRKIIHNDEWWFSIVDVCFVLTNSSDWGAYWRKLKQRLNKEWSEVVTFCHGLKLLAPDWKMRLTDCANTEWVLRIIQSIPSPKAEPFKRWLSQIWYDRIKEIENPELAMNRMMEIYEKKWYPKDWIELRARGVPVRKWLTNEWDKRWWSWIWYAILTNEVYKAYSWMTNEEWKKFKWMKKWNLRDWMTSIELILTMLAEQSTTDITIARNAKWITELKKAGKDGWGVAFKARQELIEQTWNDPITSENFLENVENKSKLKDSEET